MSLNAEDIYGTSIQVQKSVEFLPVSFRKTLTDHLYNTLCFCERCRASYSNLTQTRLDVLPCYTGGVEGVRDLYDGGMHHALNSEHLSTVGDFCQHIAQMFVGYDSS